MFFVFRIEVLEVFGREITFAEFKVQTGAAGLDLNVAILAVAQQIVAGVAQHVVHRAVSLHAVEDLAEIVTVQEGFAAGVGSQRGERFLAGKVGIQCVLYSRAGVHGRTAQAGGRCRAAGRHSFEPASIERVNGHVGFHRGVDRGAQSRLVLNPRLSHAAGKINQRLLLIELGQHLANGLQCL